MEHIGWYVSSVLRGSRSQDRSRDLLGKHPGKIKEDKARIGRESLRMVTHWCDAWKGGERKEED